MSTGNHVAEYKVTHETCQNCNGAGQIFANIYDPWQMEKFLRSMEMLDLESKINKVRDIRHSGRTDCWVCNGRGKVERMK